MVAALGLIPPLLSAALSFAQAPPPVPALPDSERRTQYSISASTCACSVGFALYGSGTDVDSWLEVWVAGARYLSTDPSHGWGLTSATGTIATSPRPITDAVLTFTAVQTGVVQIVGAERPRRLSQFQENRGVAARDLNQALTDIIAQNRETWDKINDVTGRGFFAPPGSTGGTITGPLNGVISSLGPFTSGHVAIWNGSSGTSLADGIPGGGRLAISAAPFSTTQNYSGTTTGALILSALGTLSVPDATQDSTGIFQKIGSSTLTSGKNATVYVSARKQANCNNCGETALFAEGQDDVGGSGSFIEGLRGHAVLAAGTGGNGTGVIGVGIAPAASSYKLLAGFEGQLFNNNADATTTFSSANFEAVYLSSNQGTKKSFAGFMTNPFSATALLNGVYIAIGGVSDTAFRSDAALVHLLDGSRGTCSSTCITTPGFTVGATGVTAVNLNAAAAPTATTSGFNVAGADGAGSGYGIDTFAGVGAMVFRRANTTNAAPSKLLSADQIGQMSWRGWDNSGVYSNNQAVIRATAAEDWNDATHRGINLIFLTTPTASAAIAQAMEVFASGGVGVGASAADPGINNITATAYKSGATQVVGARVTGYTAMTGTPDKATAFATSTVTLAQLAGRMMQLQADLTTHGLIGP